MLTLHGTGTEQAHLLVRPRSRVKTTHHPRMVWLGFATGLKQKPQSPGLVLPPRLKSLEPQDSGWPCHGPSRGPEMPLDQRQQPLPAFSRTGLCFMEHLILFPLLKDELSPQRILKVHQEC